MLELRGEAGIATPDRYALQVRSGGRSARLEGVVRQEILPRLLQAHILAAAPALPVETLARALIEDDAAAADAAFALLSAVCVDEVQVLREVLTPAARRLGEWWVEDSCDFFSVTKGLTRLRRYLASVAAPDGAGGQVLLMLTPPGETHRFGAEMAADLFRREGWRVERADGDLKALAMTSFDAVAVSCGCEQAAASLPAFIAEIKARSPGAPILLGGALFLGHPARGQNLGVEFVSCDPDFCRRISRALLKRR